MWDDVWIPILIGMLIIVFLIGMIVVPCIYSSKRKAELFNEKYGTSYTTSDFFWAESTVKELVEGIKHRIELE